MLRSNNQVLYTMQLRRGAAKQVRERPRRWKLSGKKLNMTCRVFLQKKKKGVIRILNIVGTLVSFVVALDRNAVEGLRVTLA